MMNIVSGEDENILREKKNILWRKEKNDAHFRGMCYDRAEIRIGRRGTSNELET